MINRVQDKDIDKLTRLLAAVDRDAADYRELSWLDSGKWKAALRLLRQGESRGTKEVLKQYYRWSDKREAAHTTGGAAQPAEMEAKAIADSWAAAETALGEVTGPGSCDAHLIIHDLGGDATVFERSRVSWSGFASATCLSPFLEEAPDGILLKRITERYFDIFPALDAAIANAPGDRICLLDSACALYAIPRHPLPVALHLEGGGRTPSFTPDQLPRQALFPWRPPCLLFDRSLLAGKPDWFATFQDLGFWAAALAAIEDLASPGEPPVALVPQNRPDSCESNRRWLGIHQPDLLPELRDVREEWDSLHHDLIVRVADHFHPLFARHASYLAAVYHAGIRR